MKIAICAGHGINTAGKRTPDGMREFEFNVKVAGYLAEFLKQYEGVSTFYVHDHPTGKNEIPLATRTNHANREKADLYLSIHANAFGSGGWNTANGVETYIHPNTLGGTINIATVIHNEIIKATKRRDRGLKRANFYVLRETNMPAVLVECGFMTNKEEAALLKTDAYRKTCANAIGKAIVGHYNLKRKPSGPSGIFHRIIVDGKQIGSFQEPENAIRQAMRSISQSDTGKIEIHKVKL